MIMLGMVEAKTPIKKIPSGRVHSAMKARLISGKDDDLITSKIISKTVRQMITARKLRPIIRVGSAIPKRVAIKCGSFCFVWAIFVNSAI